jgi:hypothetical protein
MSPPLPDWTAFFNLRPELKPPGYEETVARIRENPFVKPKELKKEEKRRNNTKPRTKLGKNETH